MKTRSLDRKALLIFTTVLLLFLSYVIDGFSSSTAAQDPREELNSPSSCMLQGLESHATHIHMQHWRLNADEIMQLFQELMEHEPCLFFVLPKLSYAYDENGFVTEIYPQYRMGIEETEIARARLIQYLEDFANTVHPDMQEADKALLIHDHIIENYVYSPAGEENYDMYSLFMDGHGVCQAFSLMYMALGKRIGLTVGLVTSHVMDHAWNHVQIDGNYYHVDVTRDLSNQETRNHHDRFLLCDISMKNKGYVDFSCSGDHICDSHAYESNTEHSGLMHAITGYSVYIGKSWLSYDADEGFITVSLSENLLPEDRIVGGADLNDDGKVSLEDLLLLNRFCRSEQSKVISQALLNLLLENALSKNN